MRRFIFALGAVLALTTISVSSPNKVVKTGTLKAFGFVKDAGGRKVQLQGMQFPYTIERIEAKTIRLKKKVKGQPVSTGKGDDLLVRYGQRLLASIAASPVALMPVAMFDTTVYMADSNTTYGVFEEDNPSALDDLVLSGGLDAPWKHLTFGFGLTSVPSKFLVRWRCYANMVTGQGAAGAFNQEFADFGVYLESSDIPGGMPGNYKLTIDVQASGATAPTNSIWVASQFRIPRPTGVPEDGEGPFDFRVTNIFNNTAPPSVGSSENTFYYDWDPIDGIYSENEVEQVNEGLSNLLFGIVTGGTLSVRTPSSVTVPQGTLTSNPEDSIDLVTDSDNQYVKGKPVYNVPRNMAPLQFQFQATAGGTTATSLTFKVETSATSAGGTQSIKLYSYLLSSWIEVDSRPITSLDSVTQFTIATLPTQFILQNGGSGQIRARVDLFPAQDVSRNWEARVDQAQWRITRP